MGEDHCAVAVGGTRRAGCRLVRAALPSRSPYPPKKAQEKANEPDTNNNAKEQNNRVPKAKPTRLGKLRKIAQGDEQQPSKQYAPNKGGDSSGHWVHRDLQRHGHELQSPMLASHRSATHQSPPSARDFRAGGAALPWRSTVQASLRQRPARATTTRRARPLQHRVRCLSSAPPRRGFFASPIT